MFVCSNCFYSDYAIAKFIDKNANELKCSYCKKIGTHPIALDIESVAEFMLEAINEFYEDPIEQVSWDAQEGGWQGIDVFCTDDILMREGIEFSNHDLYKNIFSILPDHEWCHSEDLEFQRQPHHKMLHASWNHFSSIIKNQIRFIFFKYDTAHFHLSEDEINYTYPGEILNWISKYINIFSLVKTASIGDDIYRAIQHENPSPDDFAPPAFHHSQYSGRMNPAGIPIFYCALDASTAYKETERSDSPISIAKFTVKKQFKYIDLTSTPKSLSIFDKEKRDYIEAAIFMKKFAVDISRPTDKTGFEHVEYVPAQVFAEYIKLVFRDEENAKIYGIAYQSSITESGKCVALFFNSSKNSAYLYKHWLEFADYSPS